MGTREIYKQKIEAEMELAQATLAEFKAHAKNYAADAHIKFSQHMEELDKMAHDTKIKLEELYKAGDDEWEKLKDGVQSAWDVSHTAIKDAVAKYKFKYNTCIGSR